MNFLLFQILYSWNVANFISLRMSSQDGGFAELLQYQLKGLQEKNVKIEWDQHLQKSLNTHKSCYIENTKIVANIENGLNDLSALHQNTTDNLKQLNSLSENSNTSKEKCEALRLENKKLTEEIEEKRQEFQKVKEQLEDQRKQIEEKNVVINARTELYKRLLGLEIRVLKNNRMQFVFKCSGKADCYIIISLNDRVYGVLESYPLLENLKSMEDDLNKTNNLAGFIQYSRMILQKQLENST
ncbi:uncharacterized protein LOC120327559 [Styela clava]